MNGGSIGPVPSRGKVNDAVTQVRHLMSLPRSLDRCLLEMQPLTRWLLIGFLVALNGLLFSWLHWMYG